MNWPFSKAVERRASYTDAVVEALLARSGTPAQPSKLAAVEIAAGWTGRALSMAELSPASVLDRSRECSSPVEHRAEAYIPRRSRLRPVSRGRSRPLN